MPWENTLLTPLPEPNKPKYISELIDDATSKGAKIINKNGGKKFKNFVFPAVLYPRFEDMDVYKEEQFDRLFQIISFSDINTLINFMADLTMDKLEFENSEEKLGPIIDSLVNLVGKIK